MTSKRPHTKSRLGCRQCKGRRIRCDQTAPCCNKCAKRGLECEYQEWAQLLTPGAFGNATLQSSSIPPSSAPSTITESLNLEDLGLLHHFTLYTSQTLGALESERYRYIWQHEVPKLALSHPPLMHAILAFAAAHQASVDEKSPAVRSQMQLARAHYSNALVSFRGSVKDLSAESADVLLCYCNLICFLTLFLEFDKPIKEQDPIGDFVSLLGILHSSVGVLQLVEEPIRECAIGELLQHKWNSQRHSVAPEVASSLDKLDVLVEQHRGQPEFDENATACLKDAILNLRNVFELTEPRPQSWVYLLSWPINLGSEFSTLIQQRNPIALCMLCHWLVPAHNAPVKWHIGDWPRRLMVAVSKDLENSALDNIRMEQCARSHCKDSSAKGMCAGRVEFEYRRFGGVGGSGSSAAPAARFATGDSGETEIVGREAEKPRAGESQTENAGLEEDEIQQGGGSAVDVVDGDEDTSMRERETLAA